MRCEVCGQDYGLAHNCAGVAAAHMTEEEAAPAPTGFAPFYYLRLAFKIVCWDDVSIRRASRDFRSGLYGFLFWTIAATIILVITVAPQILKSTQFTGPTAVVGLALGLIFGLFAMGIITLAQLGLCHLIAKWFFGATGTFITVMRPLLLGWFVNALILIPVVGMWAAGVAWIAVLMLVFEEVDGIGRLQAFLISAGVNVCFMVLQFALPIRHA